ncbi:MAG: hypothetical protein U0610_07375 [bacterium]
MIQAVDALTRQVEHVSFWKETGSTSPRVRTQNQALFVPPPEVPLERVPGEGSDGEGESLHTPFCEMFGIEYPIIAFTHCRTWWSRSPTPAASSVLGEAMHTPDEISADIKWTAIASVPSPSAWISILPVLLAGGLDELQSKIPDGHRAYAKMIHEKYDVPAPKGKRRFTNGARLNQQMARAQLEMLLEEQVPLLSRPRQPGVHRCRSCPRHQGVRADRQDSSGQA